MQKILRTLGITLGAALLLAACSQAPVEDVDAMMEEKDGSAMMEKKDGEAMMEEKDGEAMMEEK